NVDGISDDIWKIWEEFKLPRTPHLQLSTSRLYLSTRKVKYILCQCSSVLEKLTLSITISSIEDEKNGKKEEQQQEEHEVWPRLKTLTLKKWEDRSRSKAFWPWLWKRCDHLETLEVEQSGTSVQNLAEGMLAHMPNLSSITLGETYWCDYKLKNNDMVTLLSSSRKGWKVVKIRYTEQLDRTAKEALAKHFHTLEVLEVRECHGVYGDYLVQVLSSCPKLRTLAIQIGNPHPTNTSQDLRPTCLLTGILTQAYSRHGPVNSLKVLKIMVTGTHDTEPSVRISRLTNLETLWLGYRQPYVTHPRKLRDSLEMSLESRLDKLSGLKALKELDVSSMKTRINLRELQWMIEH
ncbi:hypothetical protein BGZ65_005693, partial [Modicella reniformis]